MTPCCCAIKVNLFDEYSFMLSYFIPSKLRNFAFDTVKGNEIYLKC